MVYGTMFRKACSERPVHLNFLLQQPDNWLSSPNVNVISASNVIIILHFLEGVEVTQKQKLYILYITSFTIITN